MISQTLLPVTRRKVSRAAGVRCTSNSAPQLTLATTIMSRCCTSATIPGKTFRALNPSGGVVASRMSPARMPTVKTRDRSIRDSGTSSWTPEFPARQVIVPCSECSETKLHSEDVLESCQLGHGLELWPLQHLVRRTAGHDSSRLDRQNMMAESKDLFTMMSDVEDRKILLVFHALRSSRIWALVGVSSAVSGSSSSKTRGRVTSARASAARWRSPPEISLGRRLVSCAMRNNSSISPLRVSRSWRSSHARP